jgi:glycosyltransferase involved in cell wall biosynthesis
LNKIVHVITGLNNGGAEAVLYRLCAYDKSHNHSVISLMNEGKYGPLLEEAGVVVHCLNMPAGRVTLSGLYQLFRLIRKIKPDVVQTWMYHADLIGGIIARLAGIKNVFWNIRHTTLEPGHSKRSTILIANLCAKLSKIVPKGIVCCAKKAVEVHGEIGYDSSKMTVIANGYDLSDLRVIPNSQVLLTEELGDIFPLIGMVGRFDPQKDHFGLLDAFALVKNTGVPHKLALVGRDLNTSNVALIEEVQFLGLKGEVLLLDQRTDIPTIMNSLDLHVLSSSFGEAFPNVLAEAMACGTPCVTTDVGDAGFIVGKTGWVVPPKNPQAIADAILIALNEQQTNPEAWESRKVACRERVVENFTIEIMTEKYHQVWSLD